MAFSADGRLLAAAGQGIRLWRLGDDGPVGETLTPPIVNQSVQVVSLSDSGRWLAASVDQTIRLWDREQPESTRLQQILRGHEQSIQILAFSSDGAWLASASQDGDVRLWNLTADQIQDSMIVLRASGEQERQHIEELLFDPDGGWLAGRGHNGVHFWQLDAAGLVDAARQLAARDLSSEELERYRLNTPDHLRDRLLRLAAEISKQLEKNPQDATLLKRRADLYACAGQSQQAIDELRLFIRLNPEEHYAQYQLLALLAETRDAKAYLRG